MKSLENLKYEIFITNTTGSCAGKHLELNVWDCEDDSLIQIAQRLVNQLRCADYEIGLTKDKSDDLDNLDNEHIFGQCFNPD